jgi:hypothetical protein
MSLPDELLNRRNKDLKEKIQVLHANHARNVNALQLERDVLRVTDSKLSEARTQMASLQDVLDRRQQAAGDESSYVSKLKAEVEKVKSTLTAIKVKYSDISKKVAFVEKEFDGRKHLLADAENKRSELENLMITWAGDNALTGEAKRMADGVLKSRVQQLRDLQKEADSKLTIIRAVEEAMWEEATTTDQIRADVLATRRTVEMLEIEKHEAYIQLQQAVTREEAAGENKRIAQEKASFIRENIDVKKRELAQVAAELEAQRSLERQTLAARGTADTLRQRAEAKLRAARDAMTDEERQCEDLEREAQLAEIDLANFTRTRQERLSALSETSDKLEKLMKRLAELADEERKAIEDGLGNDASVTALQREQEQMLRFLYSQIMELDSASQRGRHLLQIQKQEQMEVVAETENITNEMALLQRATGKVISQEHQLKATLKAITDASASIEIQGSEVEALLHEEAMKRNEANSEVRAALKVRIVELREDLSHLERDTTQGKRAVEELAVFLRREGRSMGDEQSLLDELINEEQRSIAEINHLNSDLVKLSEEKQKVAETAEGLHWKVVELQRRTDDKKGLVRDALLDQAAIEQELRERDMIIQSEINGTLVELHAHQEDEHRLKTRYNDANHRLTLLRSRHEDLLSAMKRRVAVGASDISVEMGVGGGATSSSDTLYIQAAKDGLTGALTLFTGDEDEGTIGYGGDADDLTSIEELQARAFMQRALVRERLQDRGDYLDRAIVSSEKQLRRVTTALEKLEKSVADGRTRILAGGDDVDDVYFGIEPNHNNLQIEYQTNNNGVLVPFTNNNDEVTRILDEQRQNDLLAQIHMYEDGIHSLDESLHQARVEESEVYGVLREEEQKLEEARSTKQQLQRRLVEVSRGNTIEHTQTEKFRQVAFQKQLAFVRNAGAAATSGATTTTPSMGTVAICNTLMEEANKLDLVCCKLVDLAARQQPSAFDSSGLPNTNTHHHQDPSPTSRLPKYGPRSAQGLAKRNQHPAKQPTSCLDHLTAVAGKYGLVLPAPQETMSLSGNASSSDARPFIQDITQVQNLALNQQQQQRTLVPLGGRMRTHSTSSTVAGSGAGVVKSFDFSSLQPRSGPKREATKALVEAYKSTLTSVANTSQRRSPSSMSGKPTTAPIATARRAPSSASSVTQRTTLLRK